MARCALEATHAQGALSEFMRKISLTTEPPTPDRRLGCSEDMDSEIRTGLRLQFLYGRILILLRSSVINLDLRPLIVRRHGYGGIRIFCWMDELLRQALQFRAFAENLHRPFTSLLIGVLLHIPFCAVLDFDDGRVMLRCGHFPLSILIVNHDA